MRVNVYAEEITEEIKLIRKVESNGKEFLGIRLYLKSHNDLHFTELDGITFDDDRSAITLWVPWTEERGHDTQFLSRILERMADTVGRAKSSLSPNVRS